MRSHCVFLLTLYGALVGVSVPPVNSGCFSLQNSSLKGFYSKERLMSVQDWKRTTNSLGSSHQEEGSITPPLNYGMSLLVLWSTECGRRATSKAKPEWKCTTSQQAPAARGVNKTCGALGSANLCWLLTEATQASLAHTNVRNNKSLR